MTFRAFALEEQKNFVQEIFWQFYCVLQQNVEILLTFDKF